MVTAAAVHFVHVEWNGRGEGTGGAGKEGSIRRRRGGGVKEEGEGGGLLDAWHKAEDAARSCAWRPRWWRVAGGVGVGQCLWWWWWCGDAGGVVMLVVW
eukprot:354339-Chlamydomonas_euryale.AAC.4